MRSRKRAGNLAGLGSSCLPRVVRAHVCVGESTRDRKTPSTRLPSSGGPIQSSGNRYTRFSDFQRTPLRFRTFASVSNERVFTKILTDWKTCPCDGVANVLNTRSGLIFLTLAHSIK